MTAHHHICVDKLTYNQKVQIKDRISIQRRVAVTSIIAQKCIRSCIIEAILSSQKLLIIKMIRDPR